eukprot:Sspe_Gene.39443::Locus_19029_Transcript_1_1_Confidence_1.000_Length_2398::g.39443::m.39443
MAERENGAPQEETRDPRSSKYQGAHDEPRRRERRPPQHHTKKYKTGRWKPLAEHCTFVLVKPEPDETDEEGVNLLVLTKAAHGGMELTCRRTTQYPRKYIQYTKAGGNIWDATLDESTEKMLSSLLNWAPRTSPSSVLKVNLGVMRYNEHLTYKDNAQFLPKSRFTWSAVSSALRNHDLTWNFVKGLEKESIDRLREALCDEGFEEVPPDPTTLWEVKVGSHPWEMMTTLRDVGDGHVAVVEKSQCKEISRFDVAHPSRGIDWRMQVESRAEGPGKEDETQEDRFMVNKRGVLCIPFNVRYNAVMRKKEERVYAKGHIMRVAFTSTTLSLWGTSEVKESTHAVVTCPALEGGLGDRELIAAHFQPFVTLLWRVLGRADAAVWPPERVERLVSRSTQLGTAPETVSPAASDDDSGSNASNPGDCTTPSPQPSGSPPRAPPPIAS